MFLPEDRVSALKDAIEAEKPHPARILFIDIERVPGRARHQHRGLTIEGDFWDLNSWKHTIGYRLPPESVLEWPRTICAAWKWAGAKRVEFTSEWADGPDAMFKRCWDAYDHADIVVGHNIDGFDTKHLNEAWWEAGLGAPSPYRSVDTLKVARAKLGAESKTLQSLLTRIGLQGKTDKYNVQMARQACAGHTPSQRRLRGYNVGDIHATEALYDALKGWNPSHPHMGLYSGEERSCYQCGSTDLVATGQTSKTPRTAYANFRCADCGAMSRNGHRKTIVTLVPAR